MTQDNKLVIIHQYPTHILPPFLNPICKSTFNALPNIYRQSTKKRYFYNVNDRFKYHPTKFHRNCCIEQLQQERSSTQMKPVKRRRVNTEFTWTEEAEKKPKMTKISEHIPINIQKINTINRQIKSAVKNIKLMKKPLKIVLPNLKVFENEIYQQSETKHKVLSNRGSPSKLSQLQMEVKNNAQRNISRERLEKIDKKHNIRQSQVQTQIHYDPSQSSLERTSIPVQVVQEKPPNKYNKYDHTQKKNHLKTNKSNYQSANFARPFYQNLDKGSEQPQKTRKKEARSIPSIKGLQKSQLNVRSKQVDKDLHITGQPNELYRSNTNSTIFHENKVKYSSNIPKRKSRKNSIVYSVLSNGLFRIPQEEELEDYLLNYRSMNPEFHIEQLIKEHNFSIIPAQDNIYLGQVQNDKKHGKGIMLTQKELYEGEYDDDNKTYGFEKNRDGVYTGQFLNGKRHGKGKFLWVNGQTFQGDWKLGKKTGQGIWKSPKGDFYEGQWKQNRQTGKGYHYHHGGSTYRGFFKDFLKHGKGFQQFANGDKYNGDYVQGKPNGEGKYVWKDGDYYQGSFKEGSREGKGIFTKVNGDKYQGDFKNDMKNGFGRQKMRSGQLFEGQFKQNQRTQGKITSKSGQECFISQK